MATNLPSCFLFSFRTTPEVSSKTYLVELCQVSEKLWLLISKELTFGFQILDLKDHFSASLIKFISPLQSVSLFYFNRLFQI